MKLSLTKKLVGGGLLLVALPFFVLGWYAVMTSSKALMHSGEQTSLNLAQQAARMTDLIMKEELKLAWELSLGNTTIDTAGQVVKAGISGAADAIENLKRKLVSFGKSSAGQGYENIFVADLNGDLYANSIGKDLKLNVSDRRYFQTAKSGKPSVDQVMISKMSGKPVAAIAVPVKDPATGNVTGVLAAIMDIGFLIESVSGTRVGETGYAWMVNADGDFISHPSAEVILKENIKKMEGMEAISREMLSGGKGVMSYVYKGVTKTCGYAPVPLNGWAVAFTQNMEEFLSGASAIRKGMLVIGIIALSLATLLVVFGAKGISQPIFRVSDGLNEAANQVSSAATEVSTSSQQLAESSTEQAASIEEISASLEEITSMSRQNAQHAQEADKLTQSALGVVKDTSHVMEDLTQSMREISEASSETSKIIKTIDEIAFQTNLLALNAAVEAARAGDAGAGFAVVADEVRNLALRAAQAAKSTQDLIENTVRKVTTGGQLVEKSSGAFTQVIETTSKVAELMAEIAEASNEQAKGVDQINGAVLDMEKVTQTIAAGAEESAAASEEMYGQAESMNAYVSDLLKVVNGTSVRHETPDLNRKRLSHGEKIQKRSGNERGRRSGKGQPATQNVRQIAKADPAKVIPMDDDFSDF
ncbi:MAG: methyl-accepting chemotaxis protein [Pseudomonadota bacterium]